MKYQSMDAVLSEVKGVYIAVGDAGHHLLSFYRQARPFPPDFYRFMEAISIHNALIEKFSQGRLS